MSFRFTSTESLLRIIEEGRVSSVLDAVYKAEGELTGRSEDEIFSEMQRRYRIMKASASKALTSKVPMNPKLFRAQVQGMEKSMQSGGIQTHHAPIILKGALYSMSVMECNACMGCIVAAPTAGSSGVLPGCLMALEEEGRIDEQKAVKAMLVSSGIGVIIGSKSTFSAAEAGCQAEIGVSTAMAAGAIAYLSGCNAEEIFHAAALSLKNMLGLACDPVGGLVEVPCIKRNSFGVSHAFLAADLVLLGVRSAIPFDDVIDAMNSIAKSMQSEIRETARGGLATTKTGKRLYEEFLQSKNETKIDQSQTAMFV